VNGLNLVDFTSRGDCPAVVDLHTYVISKIVIYYSDSTADIVRIYLMLVDHVSNIDSIPTEISHILCETIPLY
jgi:hypothetical protein